MKCSKCPYTDLPKNCFIECDFKIEKSNAKKKYKPIPKVSAKRELEDIEYRKLRLEFLSKKENKKCPVTGKLATQIHHKLKRRGYADAWARENKVSLYLDIRFWIGVSQSGHEQIEKNVDWAVEMGYSIRSNQKF